MGRSSWAIRVRTLQELEQVLETVKDHNMSEDVGETLTLSYVTKYEGDRFLVLENSGGREKTNLYLLGRLQMLIYLPFAKPPTFDQGPIIREGLNLNEPTNCLWTLIKASL